ncbi:MAG: mandelate racemase/muconate lactonizing enzyme family protein [Acetobacteraceae bacterium]|nr:mandelate racemase/muconate lactonizing enzyme family protein [Acetobacteraceae bacterium]
MRVTKVACHVLQARLDRPFTSARGTVHATRSCCLVELATDAGITGWGECRGPAMIARAAVDHLGPHLVGRDPFDAGVIWEELYNQVRDDGRSGVTVAAISGIDIALHDLMGKEIGRPAHQLLGGGFRSTLPACASGLFFSDPEHLIDEAVDEAAHYVAQGFRAIRMKIGLGDLVLDVARIKAVRDALGPDIRLSVDADHCLGVSQAIRLGRALEALDVLCFEDPLAPEDLAGSAEVARALDIAVAGGGRTFTRWGFRDLVEQRAVDLAAPDVTAAGGLSETMRIAALCSAHGIDCAPRAEGSVVGLAASVHALAALPDRPAAWRPFPAMLTFEQTPNPLREALAVEPITLAGGGVVAVPAGPGLGIEIDRAVLERYRIF